MNIALLLPNLEGGGAQRVASILGDYYYDKGHKIYYFFVDERASQKYKVKGQIVHSQVQPNIREDENWGVAFAKLLISSFKIRRIKAKYKIDVAISFMEYCNYLNILSKGKEKAIVSVHTILSKRKDFTSPFYQFQLIHLFYNFASNIVVPSKYAKWDLYKNYNIHKKIYTIYNPSFRPNSQPDKEKWIFGDEAVICIGRLEAVKQQERIIRAFTVVHRQNSKARLLILGEGPNKRYLENLCRELRLEDVVFFLGFKENVGYYLQYSRLFVMSSAVEGFPVSMVEAMAYGIPVISTDSPGGCGEILGKKSIEDKVEKIRYDEYGIITPYISGKLKRNHDLEEHEIMLGNAINELLNDPYLYQKYHRQSLKRASMYDVENIMRRWDRLIFD